MKSLLKTFPLKNIFKKISTISVKKSSKSQLFSPLISITWFIKSINMKIVIISFAITFSVLLNHFAFAGPPPSIPTPINVMATANNGQAIISFDTTNSSEHITSFTVTSNPDGITKDSLSTNIIVTGLTNGVTYTFTVVANGLSSQSSASAPSNELPFSTIPNAPTNIVAKASNGQATIYFDAPSDNGSAAVVNYTVTSSPENMVASGNGSPITVTGLSNFTEYTFTVVAENIYGSSEPSSISNIVTPCNYSAPLVMADTICNEGQVNFSTFSDGRIKGPPPSNYTWYDQENNIVGTGTNFTTPSINTTTPYAVTFTYLGCESPKRHVSAVVNYSPDQPSITSPPMLCDSGSTLLNASNIIFRTNTTDEISYEWRDSQRQLLASTAAYQTPVLYLSTTYLVTASYKGCVSDTASVNVNVIHLGAPQGVDSLVCGPGEVRLHAMIDPSRTTGPINPVIHWYDNINGTSIATGELFVTPTIETSTDYYASITFSGCESAKTMVSATVINIPNLPQVSQDSYPCDSGTVLLSLTYPASRTNKHGSISYDWTDASYTVLGAGESFQTPKLYGATEFRYIRNINGCQSDTASVMASLGNPYTPQVTDSVICGPGSVRLHASSEIPRTKNLAPMEIYWYDVPKDGSHVGTGDLFETPVIDNTTTYYAVIAQNGCESERIPVQAFVKSKPAMPVVIQSKNIICNGDSVLLSAQLPLGRQANCRGCGDNNTYEWRDINHTVVFNDADFQTSKLFDNTIYSLTATDNGCTSDTAKVNVTVSTIPSPVLTDTSFCGPGVATLHASLQPLRANKPSLPVIQWYDSPIKDSIIATGETFITPTLSTSTYYYASTADAGCNSPRIPVRVGVINVPAAPFVEIPTPKCDSGAFELTALIPTKINCRGNCNPNQYVWTDYNDNIVSNDANFNTGLLKNTYTTYNVKAIYRGCYSEPTQVTVQVIHAWQPMATDSAICGEGKTKLSIQIPVREKARMIGCDNCLTYAWTNEANDTLGYGTSFITPLINKNTTYYVQSSEYGCISPKTEVVAHVSTEFPTITTQPISKYVCLGDSITLKIKAKSNDPRYYICIYYGEGDIQPGGETDSIYGFRPDENFNNIKFVYIAYNNCGMDTSNVFEVRVNQADTLVTQTNNTLSVQQENATYQWINADTKAIIDGETGMTFTPTVSGNYAAVISLNECQALDTTGAHYMTVTISGLNNSPKTSFTVYPNPAADILNIALTEAISGNVAITDIHGNEVANKTVSGAQFNISTADLTSGVYVLKIASASQTLTKQVVIVK